MRYSARTVNVFMLFYILLTMRILEAEQTVYFTMTSYNVTIPKDYPHDKAIAQMYVRTSPNITSLVFDIHETMMRGRPTDDNSREKVHRHFAIEQTTGQVYFQQPFDSRENITGWNFTLQISAWAQRERSGLLETKPVDIAIMTVDVTTKPPPCYCFKKTHYMFRLRSDSRNGVFGSLKSDPQCFSTDGAFTKYSVISDNNIEWLHVDSQTAELTLRRHPTTLLQSINLTVQCVMETTGSNQTQPDSALVLLQVTQSPDYIYIVQHNRSKGDHVTWVRSSNLDVIKWKTIDVLLTGKHSHFYSFNTMFDTSPVLTPTPTNRKVIGEIVLLRSLPTCLEDIHTLTLQLSDGKSSEDPVARIIIQVEFHALKNSTSSILNLKIQRNASSFTRVTALEDPSCTPSSADKIKKSLEIQPDDGFLRVESTSMLVYIDDTSILNNISLTSYIVAVKLLKTWDGAGFQMEWKLQIEIAGKRTDQENLSCNKITCSKHSTRTSCENACGIGAPDGRCKWREQRQSILASEDFSTCSPDFATCPNQICDTLEHQFPILCPQDCIDSSGGNWKFMMSSERLGIQAALGPCSCDKNGLQCTCQNIMPRITSGQTTQTSTIIEQVPYSLGMTTKAKQQASEPFLQCAVCDTLVPVIILLVAIVCLAYTVRRRLSFCRLFYGNSYKPPVIIDGSDSRLNSVLSECSDDGLYLNRFSVTRLKTQFDPKWEFSRRNLVFDKVLGEGEFGRVVRAQALTLRGHTGYTTVAVKMLKGSYTSEDLQDLITEMNLLKDLNHPNIIKLLGASTQKGPLYVIVEYCHHGCLRDFLRRNRHVSSSQDEATFPKDHVDQILCEDSMAKLVLNNRNLLSFAWQICKGMQYLAMLKLVHRDLAARNILVCEDMVIKVSDFGLARDLYESGTYVKTSKSRIPMKWMAPESLFDNIYTTKTDIWSYGVLFWEIITMGSMPYPGISSNKLCQLIRQGERLERPEGCADELYSLMQQCWQATPHDRPSFDELGAMLEGIMMKDTDYLDLSSSPFGDCADDEELNNDSRNDQTTSCDIPLMQIPSHDITERTSLSLSLTKDHFNISSEFSLKEIITEETNMDSGPLYEDIDPCRLYSNNTFVSDHLSRTVSEPNISVCSVFQDR